MRPALWGAWPASMTRTTRTTLGRRLSAVTTGTLVVPWGGRAKPFPGARSVGVISTGADTSQLMKLWAGEKSLDAVKMAIPI